MQVDTKEKGMFVSHPGWLIPGGVKKIIYVWDANFQIMIQSEHIKDWTYGDINACIRCFKGDKIIISCFFWKMKGVRVGLARMKLDRVEAQSPQKAGTLVGQRRVDE